MALAANRGAIEYHVVVSVVVEPIRSRHTDHVRITLRTGANQFHAQLPARTAVSFVQRTESVVRLGAEERHLDLDGLIRRLGAA